MSRSHRSLSVIIIGLALGAGCSAPAGSSPDARATSVPDNPAGTFAIVSTLELQIPEVARAVVDPLIASTDGADDPARYVVDRVIAALPDGTVRVFAEWVAPLIASYLNERLAEIAPRLVAGIDAIARGTVRAAERVELIERWQIDATGSAVRTITGARFDLGAAPTTIAFEDAGLGEPSVATRVTLDHLAQLTVTEHARRVPYGALLRVGLDQVVVPSVEPGAHDLATALASLVDCARLGELVADTVGVGTPTLYRAACGAAMVAVADDLYRGVDDVAATAFELHLTGVAEGADLDGDGTMDEVRAGIWSGTLDSASSRDPLVSARFAGTK